RVENWRNGEHRDFTYREHEVIVTPAGMSSGWKWHARSRVIVVTLEPEQLERFARNELGILLTQQQLIDQPQFIDKELVEAGARMCDTLTGESQFGSAVMFESLSRVFLVKLLERYADRDPSENAFTDSFTPRHFQRVLDYIADHFGDRITVEDMAEQAAISPFHFSRLFRQTIGEPPYRFLMAYRVERAKASLSRSDEPLIDIALSCGFSDQAHFSRTFKNLTGKTPRAWRESS
ncbi:MAG: AraC family transcriptional regulator, partial [Verrucomicrobiota bacterium]